MAGGLPGRRPARIRPPQWRGDWRAWSGGGSRELPETTARFRTPQHRIRAGRNPMWRKRAHSRVELKGCASGQNDYLAGGLLLGLPGSLGAITPLRARPFWVATGDGRARQFEITCCSCPNPNTVHLTANPNASQLLTFEPLSRIAVGRAFPKGRFRPGQCTSRRRWVKVGLRVAGRMAFG